MADLLNIQTALCLIFTFVVSNEPLTAFAKKSCQLVYPSEYAYQSDSVFGSERDSANCRRYADDIYDTKHNYKHCDGTQLRLNDSDLGSEQYSSSDYYVWNAGSSGHLLLFILPTRVNLTNITLHYYSDNSRGLPRLRFNAVPDHFEIWDAPTGSYSRVDNAAVPPGGEPAGHRNVSIHLNFTTKRVLLHKYSSNFTFAVSEVEFSTCIAKSATTVTVAMVTTTSNSAETGSTLSNGFKTTNEVVNSSTTGDQDITLQHINQTGTEDEVGGTAPTDKIFILAGTVVAIVILLILSVMLATVLFLYLRKSTKKRKVDYVESSYSTLCRESVQQTQSQSLHTSNDLYDQIQLSPSTGQAEFISRNETANTNNPPPHQTEYGIHPSVDKDKPKSAKLKITASVISTQEDESTSEQPTYAVVNKKNKQKREKESVHYLQESQDSPDTTTQLSSQTIDPPQALYTAVKKKPKVEDKKIPTILPYTTEELYTAVKKTPHASTAGDDEEAPQIPPHTIEELYTAVQKKPKASATVDEEEAPPIPAHTVEELYTAVVKKPKVSRADDEEEAPPVPPYTVEEL